MDDEAIRRVFCPSACEGRVALVTGGGSGIGQEIAVKLAEYGAKVVIMGRRDAVLRDAVNQMHKKGLRHAAYVAGDVRNASDGANAVQFCVQTYGKLDVLINAAAGNFLALAENLSVNAFRTVLEIDAVGTFNMCRAALNALKDSGDARIINISATLQMPATWYQVHASAAKAAIDSMTRSLALEWGVFGIRVMSIAPGPIADTAGTTKLAGDVDPEILKDMLKEFIPVGRAGTKCDIAAAVLFLVSPAGSFASGDTWIVDGANYLYKQPMMPRDTVSGWSKSMEKKLKGKSKL